MIDLALVDTARAEAAQARRRLVDVLDERLALDPDEFVRQLAGAHGLTALGMNTLRETSPAFDLLPYAEAAEHNCVLVRDAAGSLRLVTDDPFSLEHQAWAEERIPAPFEWRLTHRRDLAAYLSSHEETLRALDAVRA